MRSINEREKALNLYFRDGKGYKTIAGELGIPLDTVKSWIRRYRKENGIEERGEYKLIKLQKSYKPREKSEKSTEERISQLEMEVDLLKNFLLEAERRSIKK